MPMVGMKMRPYYEEQIVNLAQHVNRTVPGPDGQPVQMYDVGLACGITQLELLLDIRDLLMQLALAPIWWQGRSAMDAPAGLVIAKGDVPRG